jgi:hypothetical protein
VDTDMLVRVGKGRHQSSLSALSKGWATFLLGEQVGWLAYSFYNKYKQTMDRYHRLPLHFAPNIRKWDIA